MSKQGVTLVEVLVIVLLIPILGLTVAQLDLFTQNYFIRTTREMISEQEIEIAFGTMAKDIVVANSITVHPDGGTWAAFPVTPGTTGNGIKVSIDDNNTPQNLADDDVIRYSVDATNRLVREYQVNGAGAFTPQTIARNVTTLAFTQTVNQLAPILPENLPPPSNVIQVRINAAVGSSAVNRIRYITSRAKDARL